MQNGGDKESLEIEKLRLELESERASRARTDAERRKVEAEIVKLERERELNETARIKALFEVEELKRRLEGKEPHWLAQRFQTIVVVLGVCFTAYQVYFAVHESNRKDLLTASEHLHDGYPSAAAWLAEHGSEGLRVLVQSVDAAHQLEQKAWPLTTRAALQQLLAHSTSLTEDDRKDLHDAMLRNDTALRASLTDYGQQPAPEKMTQIANLRCVQLDLQNVTGEQPPAWESTAGSIDTVFLKHPRPC
jgi:hypothetical protein